MNNNLLVFSKITLISVFFIVLGLYFSIYELKIWAFQEALLVLLSTSERDPRK
jgi:hypothetical protein